MVELVGVLNVTPDSFSDGGLFLDPEKAIKQADKLFADGATLIDVGAESTKPNAIPLKTHEEWQRLEPVLDNLLNKYPGRISLDSYHPETIVKAFGIGPVIVNDITGLNNQKMLLAIEHLKPRLGKIIISHLPDMSIQQAHRLAPVSDINEVCDVLLAKAETLMAMGFKRRQIILDPGIGFGKTMDLNRELLKFAELVPDYDVMIGYSRKRFLGEHRMELEPNLEAAKVAIRHGAKYLRVHDVAGHKRFLAEFIS